MKTQNYGMSSRVECMRDLNDAENVTRVMNARCPNPPHRVVCHCRTSALKNYQDNRTSGEEIDNPKIGTTYVPFPYDGSFTLIDIQPSNPYDYRTEFANLRYDAGLRDELWMAEKDKNYLARTHASPSILKKQYFGVGTCPCTAQVIIWQAVADYMEKRGNGTSADYPPRLFPMDGTSTLPVANSVRGYTEGPEDKKWMEERDRNYVFRLEREGRLDQIEPNLRTEVPSLYAEIMVTRQVRLAKERAQREKAARGERERSLREAQQQERPHMVAASSSSVTTPTIVSPNNVVIRWQDLTIIQGPEGELGAGGFGIVRRGTWRSVSVAVKTLLAQTMQPSTLNEFRKETEIMATLQHPNIVRLYGICLEQGHHSMVMEYMQHGSLLDFLENNPNISWSVRWNIALDISKGILCLHQHSPVIMHRDLKSPNVLLDEHNRAKICDFGLAKVRQNTRTTTTRVNPTTTRGMIGTINWMAPELLSDPSAIYTTACDIYSLGIILWELASCRAPWANATADALIINWVMQEKREPIPANTPPTFARLIANCWATRAGSRPPIAAIVQELEQHQNEIPATAAQTTTPPPPAPGST